MSAPIECKSCGKRAPEYFKCPKCGGDIAKMVDTIHTNFYYLYGDSWMTEEGDEETAFHISYHCVDEVCNWSNDEGPHDHDD